jgi:polyhydroxybutyrate depolymerase
VHDTREPTAALTTAETAQTTRGQLEAGGISRTYRLFVPSSLDRSAPAALVVVLHAGLQNGEGAVRIGGWDAEAEEGGFLTVAPDGIGRTWNAGICCGRAGLGDIDDVSFLVALVAHVGAEHDIDLDRVYATGLSNGGLMSYRLACEASGTFAAVAPVAATLPVACDPAELVSILHIHGLADRNIPFEGGFGPSGLQDVDWPPVRAGVERWVEIDGCAFEPQVEEQGMVITEVWGDCRGGTDVELVTIADGGHSWPGGQPLPAGFDPPSDAVDATPRIWAFFVAHSKRP